MFVLDTNVVSELMRPAPHPAVFAWVAAQPRASLYTTSVTRAEILSGIGIMPEGRRRAALSAAAAAMFDEDLRGRVLAFDTAGSRPLCRNHRQPSSGRGTDPYVRCIDRGNRLGRPCCRGDARYRRLCRLWRHPHQSVGGIGLTARFPKRGHLPVLRRWKMINHS